jgi:hypothetical protein
VAIFCPPDKLGNSFLRRYQLSTFFPDHIIKSPPLMSRDAPVM